ncbi:MAG TPA: M24 family metallopeptidase [Acidobacteriaceae bacterium]|nr:M24 family metallopeptidase [Acidobacteriaceae bacterium]
MTKNEMEETSKLFPASECRAELRQKHQRIQQFLAEHSLDALLVSRHENIAWATAGLVEMRVAIPSETAVGSLLFTRNGQRYYLTTNNEAPRLAQEEFASLDYNPILQPWYANDVQASIQKIAGKGNVAGDDLSSGLPLVSMQPLRLSLTESEIERYRWLGEHTAEAVTDVLLALRPGVTELTMQAMIAGRLLAQGILPTVFLMGTDDRIRKFRHAVPRNGVLQHFGMVNICARRWGLAISITRYVHFGAMPVELSEKFTVATHVNAHLWHATRQGATSDALYLVAQRAYAELGFPGEEQLHHQGGAAGYAEREWIASPGGTQRVLGNQAFAWNPSIQGAKVEDTIVLHQGKIASLTPTPRLPVVTTTCDGSVYQSAGVLLA